MHVYVFVVVVVVVMFQFGMILECIPFTSNGQPFGFSLEDSEICLRQLAKFHASHWNKPIRAKGNIDNNNRRQDK